MQPKDFDIKEYLDPLPVKPEERRQAIMKIAAWFDTELGAQLKHLIQRQEKALAMFPLSEREADFYRAGINNAHMLLEWGEKIQQERDSYVNPIAEEENAFDTIS